VVLAEPGQDGTPGIGTTVKLRMPLAEVGVWNMPEIEYVSGGPLAPNEKVSSVIGRLRLKNRVVKSVVQPEPMTRPPKASSTMVSSTTSNSISLPWAVVPLQEPSRW
jgi:hypothetical protein